MRIRTVAASAALVLCATVSAAACSSAPEAGAGDTSRPAAPASPAAPTPAEDAPERAETGKREAGAPEMDGQEVVTSPEGCATSAAEIPAECALDPEFTETTEAEPADGAPVTQ
ncbi:hypothetical protein [Streptomyces sp. NPDC058374]|uniref:hypothetical protein n=1 Tax=Streptomyces sp. NPDC058374 TaxID=3346466 RepID=UPI0036511ACC